MRIRVLLVDDNKSMREGLRQLLSGAPDMQVVGEGTGGVAGVALARSLLPDVILMDVVMPETNGIEATRQIRAVDDHVRVIAISSHSDKRYVQHMLAAGACGYVLKIAADDELVRAVRGARTDRIFLSRDLAGAISNDVANEQQAGEASA